MEYEVFEAFEKHVDVDNVAARGQLLRDNRYHILYGGRGSGKSVFATKTLALEGYLAPLQILCAREYQNSIADSSMALIWEQIEELGLDGFYVKTKTEIVGENGTRFFFRGLKTNITSIKSIAQIDRVFCEEAEAIDELSWAVLTPSIRTNGARIIICFNPRSIMDATYKRFVVNPPTGAIITKANYDANPRFPDALEQERQDMKVKDPDLYEHVWLGMPTSTSPMSIIPQKWARACIDIHKKLGIEPEGTKRMGFDVSGGGSDPNANVMLHGQVVTFAEEFRQTDPVSAAHDTWANCLSHNADEMVFDVIGVGSGTEQTLKESQFNHRVTNGIAGVKITPFNAGGAIENPKQMDTQHNKRNNELYSNLKAQRWWRMRYRCQQAWLALNDMDYDRDAVISFCSESIDHDTLEKMVFELSCPEREYLGSKLRVEPKEKLAKRGIASHNLADAVIMADYEVRGSSIAEINRLRRERRRG